MSHKSRRRGTLGSSLELGDDELRRIPDTASEVDVLVNIRLDLVQRLGAHDDAAADHLALLVEQGTAEHEDPGVHAVLVCGQVGLADLRPARRGVREVWCVDEEGPAGEGGGRHCPTENQGCCWPEEGAGKHM